MKNKYLIITSGLFYLILSLFLIIRKSRPIQAGQSMTCTGGKTPCHRTYPQDCTVNGQHGTQVCDVYNCIGPGETCEWSGPPWSTCTDCQADNGATNAPTPTSTNCSITNGGNAGYCTRNDPHNDAHHCHALCNSGWTYPCSWEGARNQTTVRCSCGNTVQCCQPPANTPTPVPPTPTPPHTTNPPPTHPPTPTPRPPTVTPGGPPTPTPAPPTNTPIPTDTPTPTPVQQEEEVDGSNLTIKTGSGEQALTEIPGQGWMCLKTTACAKHPGACSTAGSQTHRVKLEQKAPMQANKDVYIFECLETSGGYTCTSGGSTVDNKILQTSYLSMMQSTYGYNFIEMSTTAGQAINQQTNPLHSDGGGNFSPVEWESTTASEMGRIFFAVQELSNADVDGYQGGIQNGTFFFPPGILSKCVKIYWDPLGTVLDFKTGKPVEGVEVILYVKNEKGEFEKLTKLPLRGKVKNPVLTNNKGFFNFYTNNTATYKVEIRKKGYVFVTDRNSIQKRWSNIKHIYTGSEFTEQDNKPEELTIFIRKETLMDKVKKLIKYLLP